MSADVGNTACFTDVKTLNFWKESKKNIWPTSLSEPRMVESFWLCESNDDELLNIATHKEKADFLYCYVECLFGLRTGQKLLLNLGVPSKI